MSALTDCVGACREAQRALESYHAELRRLWGEDGLQYAGEEHTLPTLQHLKAEYVAAGLRVEEAEHHFTAMRVAQGWQLSEDPNR